MHGALSTGYEYFWFVDSPDGGGGQLTNNSQRSGLLSGVSQWIFPVPANFTTNQTALITVPYFDQCAHLLALPRTRLTV